MAGTLQNKVIVIIGGTSGLGLSAAGAFIRSGARVVAVGKEDEHLEAAKQTLGEAAIIMPADATDPKAAPAAIQVALGNFGRFDGLYHVAGGSGRKKGDGPLHEITDEGWTYTLDQNLNAVFYSNRAAVRQFLAQETGGSVLNLGSVLGFSPSPHYFSAHAYAAAKAALVGLTKSAAAAYAQANIRFNLLAPALVATPMSQRAQTNAEMLQFIASKQPLEGGRIGQPADLDAAAVFFLSDGSKFVTGQVLAVDGGWTISDGQIPLEQPPAPAALPNLPKTIGVVRQLAKWWLKLK